MESAYTCLVTLCREMKKKKKKKQTTERNTVSVCCVHSTVRAVASTKQSSSKSVTKVSLQSSSSKIGKAGVTARYHLQLREYFEH